MRSKHDKIAKPMRTVRILLLITYTGLIFFSCKKDPQHPGYVYLPDMDESRAYETYTENPVFEDGKTLREPAEGTIPRGHTPFPFVKSAEDLAEAGRTLFSTLETAEVDLDRGSVLFNRFCSHCHGEQGDGQGILYTSGRFPLPPGDLTAEQTVQRPDGEIYHIITVGYGIMAAHGYMIDPVDRWQIIAYIRNVIQDTTTAVN